MGFLELKQLDRRNYYKFDISGKPDSFLMKIQEVDIILNLNKHWIMSPLQKYGTNQVFVLVKGDQNESSLLKKLHSDWKRNEIRSVEHGTLWDMQFQAGTNAPVAAEKIARALLVNEHYQSFKIIG